MILALLHGCAAPASTLPQLPAGADPALASCRADQLVDIRMDGQVDVHWTEHYDEMGRKTRVEGDSDGDGVTDSRMAYTYTPEGEPLSDIWDGNADGVAELVTVHWYAPDVWPRRLVARVVMGAEGVMRVVHLEYAGDGVVVREVTDRGGDGKTDGWSDFSWDGWGNRIGLVDSPALASGGHPARTWTFDDRNLAVVELTDADGDGHDDVEQVTEYDGMGRRASSRWDTNGDGRTDNFTMWEYTCPGR